MSVRWLSQPTAAQEAFAYPDMAQRKNESGQVMLDCAIDASGGLTSCSVLDEAPQNDGFGGAALSLSKFFKADPEFAMPHAQVVFRVRFAVSSPVDTEQEIGALCERPADPEAIIRGCSAIIQSDQALRADKAQAYMTRGLAYRRIRQLDQALADLTNSIALSGALADNFNLSIEYINRGRTYEGIGLHQQAVSDFNSEIKLEPNIYAGYQGRGGVYQDMGLYDLAVSDYTRAIQLQPANQDLYLSRANSYQSSDLQDKAIEDYTKSIDIAAQEVARYPNIAPSLAVAYNGRAWSYHLKGEDAVALPDAEKAVSLAPQYAEAIETRAEAYERLGRRDEAIADYRGALRLQSNLKAAEDGLKRLGAAP